MSGELLCELGLGELGLSTLSQAATGTRDSALSSGRGRDEEAVQLLLISLLGPDRLLVCSRHQLRQRNRVHLVQLCAHMAVEVESPTLMACPQPHSASASRTACTAADEDAGA